MAELSKIRKDGVDYDIKDATAREAIEKLTQNGTGGGSGGASDGLELIADVTTEKNLSRLTISEDLNGQPFSLKKMIVELSAVTPLGTGYITPGGGDEISFNGLIRHSFIINSQAATALGKLTCFPDKPDTVTTETWKEHLFGRWELEVIDNGIILGKGRTGTRWEDADGVLHGTSGNGSGWVANQENYFISKNALAKEGLNEIGMYYMYSSLPAGTHVVIKGIRM